MNKSDAVKLTAVLIFSGLTLSGCDALGPDIHKKLKLERLPPEQAEKRPDETRFQQLANPEMDKEKGGATEEVHTGTGLFVGSKALEEGEEIPAREGKYTLNFDDADLGEVAKVILGDTLNKNYVISPGVAGRVTLQTSRPLTREELIPTLEMLLRINDTVLIREGDSYRIEPMAKALQGAGAPRLGREGRALPPGYQIRIVPLQYVGVAEMEEILKPMIREQTLIRADKMRNLLLLGGTSSELDHIIETVEIFDVDFMKGMSFALYPLRNVDTATILGELDTLFGAESGSPLAGMIRIVPIERMNALLVVTQQPQYLSEIRLWIDRLDQAPVGAGGGVNVYRVQNVDAVELAATLTEIFGGAVQKREKPVSLAPGLKPAQVRSTPAGEERTETAARRTARQEPSEAPAGGVSGLTKEELESVRIIPDAINNSLVIVATAQQYEVIKNVIKSLDIMPLQVLIDATIVEVSLTDSLQYGIQWLIESGDFAGLLSNVAGGVIGGPASGFSLAFAGTDVRAILNALSEESKINVISSPSLMVLNNQEATIKVGDQIPIRTSETSSITGLTTTTSGGVVTPPETTAAIPVTSSLQQRDTGVTLKVKPRVNAGGLVIMEIEQTVDDAKRTLTSNIDSPTIEQRQIVSTIAVQSGDTLVLGGLIRERTERSRDGVPFLHRLPWIGPLFGNTDKDLSRTELVVLITPRVVESSQQGREITLEFKRKLSGIYEERPSSAEPKQSPAPPDAGKSEAGG